MRFPMHVRHSEATCHLCPGSLVDLTPTRLAPGSGHYKGTCELCGAFTWYDCAEGTVELIDRNEARKRLDMIEQASSMRKGTVRLEELEGCPTCGNECSK